MRSFAVFIPILLLSGMCLAIVLIAAIVRKLSNWNAAYQQIAQRYGGRSLAGYLFAKPSMTFNYGGAGCRVQNRKSLGFRSGKKTELVIGWPDNRLRMQLTTSPRRSNSWNLRRVKPVEIPDPVMDGLYAYSNSPQAAEKLLTRQVQWQLEQLRRLTDQQELSVTISRGKLAVCKPGYIRHATQLDDFVRMGLELFDLMKLTHAVGIEFVNDDGLHLDEQVKCPVCSELIQAQLVICVRCRTPHCFECWQYNGQCATFGCYETRYLRSGGQRLSPNQ